MRAPVLVLAVGLIAGCSDAADERLSCNRQLFAKPGAAARVCGDRDAIDRFDACIATTTEEACGRAGGTWSRVGSATCYQCVCPTGQIACSCSRGSDCLGVCEGPYPADADLPNACGGSGTCSAAWPIAGCACLYGDDGRGTAQCVD